MQWALHVRPPMVLANQSTVTQILWHQYLGHLSSVNIPLFFILLVFFLPVAFMFVLSTQKYIFFNHTNKSVSHFNRIFCDISGGYHTLLCGAHYFLTIIDNFYHTIWLYLMHFKSKAYANLMHFFPCQKSI